ncbi:hypothetical protein Y1Q_0012550 [Alligator mississippiensis]|uniref:Uncharacterized protein n=1 Tax=Alligator mississippiensis TaxID=8496 RepID=A0A151M822_ALLMI|nr:hypothetical protein Y1Q_0012550 [Alligator mississippiensis]
MGMKLINPSDRQPLMKEILSEFGIHGISSRFTSTKIPKVKYELKESPFPTRMDSPPAIPVNISSQQQLVQKTTQLRDFIFVRNQAINMIIKAFALLDMEFQKLDIVKAELVQATITFQKEKEAYNKQFRNQQQELQEMLNKHKAQNEAWLKARAKENDKERKEICKLREEILHDQERLKEEQQSVQQRTQQLLSIMQQFKGM